MIIKKSSWCKKINKLISSQVVQLNDFEILLIYMNLMSTWVVQLLGTVDLMLARCLRRCLVMFTLTFIYVVLPSSTLAQHSNNIGSTPSVCSVVVLYEPQSCYVIDPQQSQFIVRVIHCTLWCTSIYLLTFIELKAASWDDIIFLFNFVMK